MSTYKQWQLLGLWLKLHGQFVPCLFISKSTVSNYKYIMNLITSPSLPCSYRGGPGKYKKGVNVEVIPSYHPATTERSDSQATTVTILPDSLPPVYDAIQNYSRQVCPTDCSIDNLVPFVHLNGYPNHT